MRDFFKAYFYIFIIVFIISTIRTITAEVDSESPVVYRNVSLNGRYLTYKCKDIVSWKWDISNDSLIPEKSYKRFSQRSLFDPLSLENLSDAIIAFIGGASAGYKLKDVKNSIRAKVPWTRKVKKISGRILGALSGWMLGDFVGSFWLKKCNSKSVVRYISDEKNWPDIEATILAYRIAQVLVLYRDKKELVDDYINALPVEISNFEKLIDTREDLPNKTTEVILNRLKVQKAIFSNYLPDEFLKQLENKYNYTLEDFRYITLLYAVSISIEDINSGNPYILNYLMNDLL